MTLFFYVLRDYLKYVLGTCILCTFLFVLFDFIHKTTKYFQVYKPAPFDVLLLYFYQLPLMLVQALPISSLLASVTCMVLLSRTNEITAMRAAGMGPLKIAAPVAVGGIFLSLLALILGEFVAPRAMQEMRYVEQVKIEGMAESEIDDRSHWVRSGSIIYHYTDFDVNSSQLIGVEVLELSNDFKPIRKVSARLADYDPRPELWVLRDWVLVTYKPDGQIASVDSKAQQLLDLPFNPKKMMKERRKNEELSLHELDEKVNLGRRTGTEYASYQVDYHVKLAFYFAAFVVSIIGLKFGYKSERSVETARGVLLAIAVGISYWFVLNSGKALAKRGILPPLVGAWMADVFVLSVGLLEIWRATRRKTQ